MSRQLRRTVWRKRRVVAVGIAAAILACGGSTDDREATPAPTDSAAPLVAVPDSTTQVAVEPSGGGEGCPLYGLWQECSVQDRLERAGLGVKRRDEPVHHDFLDVDGIVWTTSRSEIQVFLYPSQADRIADLQDVDTLMVQPRTGSVVWSGPATMVTSLNLTAIIISESDRTANRIALALGAGLPAK